MGWGQVETVRHSPQTYTGKNKLSLHFSRHRFIMFTLHIHPAVLGKLPLCDSRGLSKPQVSPRPAGAMWGGGGGGREGVRPPQPAGPFVLVCSSWGQGGPGPLELLSIPLEW